MTAEPLSTEQAQTEVKCPGFLARVLASLIDSALIMVILSPLLKRFSSVDHALEQRVLQELRELAAAGTLSLEKASQILSESGYMSQYQQMSLLELTSVTLIILLFWLYRSATPGKLLLCMKITDADTYGKPGISQLIMRYLGYIVSVVPLFLGFFWVAIDKRGQAWHDKIGNTLVIFDLPKGKEAWKSKLKNDAIMVTIVIVALLLLSYTG